MPVKAKYENLNLSTSPALSVPNVVYFVFKLLFKKKTFQSDKKKSKQKKYTFLSSQESSHVQLDPQKHSLHIDWFIFSFQSANSYIIFFLVT